MSRRAASLVSCLAVLTLSAPCARAAEIAVTFDDLPAHSALPPGETRLDVAQSIIAALKAGGVKEAFGFVNGALIQSEPASAAVLPAWLAAGFPLGNHTFTHQNLSNESLAAWSADVISNESLLAAEMGSRDWRWLRFPYLAEGDTADKRAAARAFLAGRGYRIAQVTISFGDYAFNEPYARCMAKGDEAAVARLEQAYLQAARDETGRAHGMSKALFGHDIPYVLLMHLGAFDARMLPRLLDLYRSEGFSFVSLQQAEKDPFYRPDLDLSGAGAGDTLEGAMAARGLHPPPGADLSSLDRICR
jgi:peptidoglycan/xylan/chitin deacetylase (PgdA/CDA1 family)